MSVSRTLGLTLIVLCVLIALGSYSVAGISEPDDWGDNVTGADLPVTDPGKLEEAYINYDEPNIQYRVDFTSADGNPLAGGSNSIVQVYIDTGTEEGIDKDTYTDGGTTEEFYDNLDNLNADYRISIGDDTNVIEPWDEDTSQFDGSNSERVAVENSSATNATVTEFEETDIGTPDEINYKFVYINDTSSSISSTDDYTWSPDPNNDDEESIRFTFEDGGETVPVGTINATINISNTPVADGTNVEFSLSDGTQEPIDHNTDNNITREFSVNSNEFVGDADDSITATIEGENYTLDKEKTGIGVTEGKVTSVTFEPHELINISGEISGLGGAEGTYSIGVENDDGEVATTGEVSFTEGEATSEYGLDVNATKFTDNGEIVATLDAPPNTISADSNTSFNTSRYNPDDITQNFTVNPPNQQLDLTTNISEANEFTENGFNITVNASANASGTSENRIDTIKHVIEFDPAQVSVTGNTSLVEDNGNETSTRSGDGVFETVVVNTSGGPVVGENGTSVPIYNLTFEFEEDFEPDHGDGVGSENTVPVSVTTVDEDTSEFGATRILNGTEEYGNTKELEFDADEPGDVDVFNSETKIEFDTEDVVHLTTGGDMVGAPVKFDVEGVTSNDGTIKEIVLYNNRTDTEEDTIDCGGDPDCDGQLRTTPSDSTFIDNGTYVSRNIFDIKAVPVKDGDNVTVNNPRGDGQEIYKRADVSLDGPDDDTGNVTLSGDVRSILDLRGQTAAGGLPWGDIEAAQHDVNNDGEIDIVDVTIVANEYEP